LCDILRSSGDPVVEEDELHVFAGKCPVLRSAGVYGDFRDSITRILSENDERYIFDVKEETGCEVEESEDEWFTRTEWNSNERLFLELIKDKGRSLISEKSWGRCQAVFQQFLSATWSMRKSILEVGNSERLVAGWPHVRQ